MGGIALSEITLAAFGARWAQPVHIIRKGKIELVAGPADALRHMRNQFSEKYGPAYCKAVNICFAAIRFEVDVDISREFFLTAYEDQIQQRRARPDAS